MSALYLVKDGNRTVALTAERDGRLHCYVPNVDAFVYNKPMSVDFLIDREMDYEPVTAQDAAAIIKEGAIGKINGRTNKSLLDWAKGETRRLDPAEVLGSNTLVDDPLPTATEVANAKAAVLRKTPLGRWIVYKTYTNTGNRQPALQMASDLRHRRIKAFRDIPVRARVLDSEDGASLVVQISRAASRRSSAAEPIKARPRAAAAAARAKKR